MGGYLGDQVYLVGDPVQLPATVISETALEHNYEMSLFKRLQMSNYPVQMLNVQYRMHPRLAAFPSQTFYGGQLQDGDRVEDATTRAWHSSPVRFPLPLPGPPEVVAVEGSCLDARAGLHCHALGQSTCHASPRALPPALCPAPPEVLA